MYIYIYNIWIMWVVHHFQLGMFLLVRLGAGPRTLYFLAVFYSFLYVYQRVS